MTLNYLTIATAILNIKIHRTGVPNKLSSEFNLAVITFEVTVDGKVWMFQAVW